MALSDKHSKFVDEYMIDMNATAAYLRAGYKCTEDAARVSASKLLTNPNIVAEIATRQAKMQEESGISVKWILEELVENHRMARQIGELPASNKALEMLGKHLGMFKDKVEISGGLSLEKVLSEL